MIRWSCAVLSVIVLASTITYAHHSIALEHDITRTLALSGVIKETDWNNPHAFVRLEVGGKTWLVTLLAPVALKRHGVDRSTLLVGKNLSVSGYPNKVQDEVFAKSITIDGKTVALSR